MEFNDDIRDNMARSNASSSVMITKTMYCHWNFVPGKFVQGEQNFH